MYLLSVQDIFSAEAIQALCWTLVHSLWQGLLLAGIVALIVLFTKKSTAAFRYNLFTGAFLLFILTVSTTFYLHTVSAASATATASLLPGDNAVQHAVIVQSGFRGKTSAGLDALAAFFDQYAGIIVFAWLLIVGLKSVKLGTGFYQLRQLKRRHTVSAGPYWSLRVQQLSARLGIKGTVQFLESGLVKVPMVIGHFKPVIFFPLGALAALPPEDVEAILMHELAHIRRRDYLVNILQHVAEIIFFFNPAVLWVSALIKTERENCCDDIALSQTGNTKTYINALVAFQEFDATLPVYATAFSNKKEYLLQRVKRMVYNNNKSLNNMEKIFIAGCIFITASLSLLYAQTNKTATAVNNQQQNSAANAPAIFNAADVPEGTAAAIPDNHSSTPRTQYVFKKDGVLYETYGDRTWMKVNGELVPEAQWGKYNMIVDKLIADYRKEKLQDTVPPVLAEKEAELARKKTEMDKLQQEQRMLEAEQKDLEAVKEELEMEKKKAEKEQASQQKAAALEAKYLQLQKEKAELEQQKAGKARQKQLELEKKSLQLQKEQLELEQKAKELELQKPVVEDKARAVTNNAKVSYRQEIDNEREHILTGLTYTTYSPYGNADAKQVDIQKTLRDITADLQKENVITSKEGLSYQLSNESLIVNGVTQSAAVYQKLRDKYIKNPDWKLVYNWRIKANPATR